jgi:hypothetical protein
MNLKAKRRERKARKAASGTPNRIATPTGSVSPDRDRRSDVQRLMLFGFESERHLGLTDLGPRAMEGSGWAIVGDNVSRDKSPDRIRLTVTLSLLALTLCSSDRSRP